MAYRGPASLLPEMILGRGVVARHQEAVNSLWQADGPCAPSPPEGGDLSLGGCWRGLTGSWAFLWRVGMDFFNLL
jgi:hypothetical protein